VSAGALIVFAKAPRAGTVKTRLCPPFTLDQAAQLYACLLADVLEASAGFAAQLGLEPVLAVHPPEAGRELARGAPRAFRVVAQHGAGLAERMERAVREAGAAGARRILLRGSDSPLLSERAVRAALEALEHADLALRPDRDGGYQLVALARPAPSLFDHAMSTGSALRDALANARAQGLAVRLLEPGFDLDTAADLRWLARARGPEAERLCPRTLAFLDAARLWRSAEPDPAR
jgi:rSAM/selenodomain-associated transferase 1